MGFANKISAMVLSEISSAQHPSVSTFILYAGSIDNIYFRHKNICSANIHIPGIYNFTLYLVSLYLKKIQL
jgi:hypothetical protein